MTHDRQRALTLGASRIDWRMTVFGAAVVAFGLFLLALMLTGQIWRAIAYGVVALFGFLFLLAGYFWGAMIFGGTLEMLARRRTPVPWDLHGMSMDVPVYNIDPGLELLSAGVLVYRIGEVKPRPYFRKIPLSNVRAVRPFVVARTGAGRQYVFKFELSDEVEVARFRDEFTFPLQDMPQIVMPPYRLLIERPRALVGQRWTLKIRSGVTVVTSFRFIFVDGSTQPVPVSPNNWSDGAYSSSDVGMVKSQQIMLPQLLDDAVKRDAMSNIQEVVLEVV